MAHVMDAMAMASKERILHRDASSPRHVHMVYHVPHMAYHIPHNGTYGCGGMGQLHAAIAARVAGGQGVFMFSKGPAARKAN